MGHRRFRCVGPYLFQEDGVRVTVTSESYCEFLKNLLSIKVSGLLNDNDPGDVWCQQDVATSHTSKNSLEILRNLFPHLLVLLQADIVWLSHSSNLATWDFSVGLAVPKQCKNSKKSDEQIREHLRQELCKKSLRRRTFSADEWKISERHFETASTMTVAI